MIIFIRKIPSNTLPSELHDFVGLALKAGLFFRSGRILGSGILVIQNHDTQTAEYHGYLHVDLEYAGRRAIKKLNGKKFKNRMVIVREYKLRNWHNDRRQNESQSDGFPERRIKDRRRSNIIVTNKNQMAFEQSLSKDIQISEYEIKGKIGKNVL